jgi:hypothetical protein
MAWSCSTRWARSDLEDAFYGIKRATFDGVNYGVVCV